MTQPGQKDIEVWHLSGVSSWDGGMSTFQLCGGQSKEPTVTRWEWEVLGVYIVGGSRQICLECIRKYQIERVNLLTKWRQHDGQ